MKKLVTLVFAMLLTGSLAFAQASQGTDQGTSTTQTDTGKKGKTKKAKKGKKSKKGASTDTTTAPPK
jgi:hypothetical protein